MDVGEVPYVLEELDISHLTDPCETQDQADLTLIQGGRPPR